MNHQHSIGVTPRVCKSPFFDSALAAGAKGVTVYNHMLMPTYYETPEADYWQLMTNVTIWDVGCERQVEITGITQKLVGIEILGEPLSGNTHHKL